jgi:mRNA interferase HicA
VKRRKLVAHLKQHGCTLVREGGKHSFWGNPQNGKRAAVPRHTEIDENLVRKIYKDLEIPNP